MSEWQEDEIVLVSAIEHFSYCPRQCALIHVEKVFDENIFTLRGNRAHERADEPDATEEDGKRIERAVPIWSSRLGLQGKADVIEFWDDGTVYPVEYKHGPRRAKAHDDLQLCAQALCLEEMLGCSITKGAIYHHSSRRRREVAFDQTLREKTERAITGVRSMLLAGVLPPPADDARCPKCSLIDACMPSAITLMSRSPGTLFEPLPEKEVV
jgi:CRISPR-associated exonuclease Cas4